MFTHGEMSDAQVRKLIKNHNILFGGHRGMKIYGTLRCHSGIRMKRINRIFFKSTEEAMGMGYRPCAHCLSAEYKKWKNEFIS